MTILIAMKELEAASSDALQALRRPGNQLLVARTQEQFLRHIEAPLEVVAVDCGLFHNVYPWGWIHALRQKQPAARIIVALDDNVYDSYSLEFIVRSADDFNWETVDVGLTREEALTQFIGFALGSTDGRARTISTRRSSGKVIAVWPASSKDGATTVAVNTALALAAQGGLRVGLIDANLRNPEIRSSMNLTGSGSNHFRLRAKLQTQSLHPEELLGACTGYRSIPRLHILPGSERRDTASDMTPEMIAHLLDVSRQAFDVTIMDLNAYPDNAATVCAVRGADERWLVAQNNYASYKTSWGEWYECYWKYCGLKPADISFILNRTVEGDKPDRLAEVLSMPLKAAIPNVPGGLGLRSVHEGLPLYLQDKASQFTDAVNRLAALVADQSGAVRSSEAAADRSKTGWVSRIAAMFT